MADDYVSLNEITGVKGDADLAYGTSGAGGSDTVFQFSKGVEMMQRAAELKQQNDRWKYEQFQQNIKDGYKNFNELDVTGVMEADYPDITKDYTALAKDMSDNIGVIRNPAANPEVYSALKQKEATLRAKIAQSKADVKYRVDYKNFLDKNPDWAFGENATKYENFNKSKLGSRAYDLPTPPEVVDITKISKFANENAQRAISTMQPSKEIKGAYIDKFGKTWTDKEIYENSWDAAGIITDNSNRPFKTLALNAMKKIGMVGKDEADDGAYKRLGSQLMRGESSSYEVSPDQAEIHANELKNRNAIEADKIKLGYAELAAKKQMHKETFLYQSGYRYGTNGKWEFPNNGYETNAFDGIDLKTLPDNYYYIDKQGNKRLKDGNITIGSDKLNVTTKELAGGFNPTFDGKMSVNELKLNKNNQVQIVIKDGIVERLIPIDDSGNASGAGTTRREMIQIQRGVNDILTNGKSEVPVYKEYNGLDFSKFGWKN
jgi:hypothetical protein